MNGKELLMGLSYIDQTLIQESEMEGKRTKGILRRPLLVAAMVALMLFLVGCAAVVLLHLEDLRIREEPAPGVFSSRENDFDATPESFLAFPFVVSAHSVFLPWYLIRKNDRPVP